MAEFLMFALVPIAVGAVAVVLLATVRWDLTGLISCYSILMDSRAVLSCEAS